ncbi:MAG TPA: hypothetical protein PLP23_15745 [Panacibacter sp.]|nr:hypothetical protein [Panacibacter sp.]
MKINGFFLEISYNSTNLRVVGNLFRQHISSQAMRKIRLFSLAVFILGCGQSSSTKQGFRDTVVERYFALIDSSGMYDTSDISYKTLKAYVQNDTTLLRKTDSFIREKHNRQNWELWKDDIPLPQLDSLNAEEAYRFIFSLQGAPAYEAITISKRDSAFKLHYLTYRHQPGSPTFDRVREFEKNISKEQWETLSNKIHEADFWNLKNDNGYRGWDGSDLTVIGYYKSGDFKRSNYVHRWANTNLTNAFYFLYQGLLNKNERQF